MPVDVLLKFTVSGKVPEVGLPVNCATGTLYGTVVPTSFE